MSENRLARLNERVKACDACGPACLTLVHCVNPGDQRDADGNGYAGEWQHVAPEKLVFGAEWGGEQCGSCGNWMFTVYRRANQWVLMCTGGDGPDAYEPDAERMDGCGAFYPIVRAQSHYVSF